MKRPKRSDPLVGTGGDMISTTMCISGTDEKVAYDNRVGNFQSILDGLGDAEEEVAGDGDDMYLQGAGSVALGEKKRRLNIEQVKALEKNFEVENKLEPERKVKLAQELGLQPRQVAVWFQNRRARWKTKQLERDYGVLKADYDALKLDHEKLKHEHGNLLAEIKELKAKLAGESYCPIKEENFELPPEEELQQQDVKKNETKQGIVNENEEGEDGSLPALIYKDGSSDSDTSIILNDDGSGAISSSSGIICHHHQFTQQTMFVGFDCSSPSATFNGRVSVRPSCTFYEHEQENLDMEENDFLHGNSSFFSDEQAPTLSWYCPDQWSSDVRLNL